MENSAEAVNSELQWLARSGGRRQRAAAAMQQAAQEFPNPVGKEAFGNTLAKHLVMEWGRGHLSAVQVQLTASLAFHDEQQLLSRLGHDPDQVSATLRGLAPLGNAMERHTVTWNLFFGNHHFRNRSWFI